MIYLIHRSGNLNNTVYRYLKDIGFFFGERNIEYQFIVSKEKNYKAENLLIDLFLKNLNYFTFLFYLTYFFLFKLKKKDKILISSDPPYFYIILYLMILLRRKIDATIWWQDIFPETFIKNKVIINIFNYFREKVLSNYKSIFISPDQQNYMTIKKKSKFNSIFVPNWSFYNYVNDKDTVNRKLKFAYLGTISVSHNIIELIKNFQKLDDEFEFYISFRPRYKKFFDNLIKDQRFKIINYLSDDEFIEFIKKMDVCIVSERKYQNQFLFPSKVITYISNNKFILYHGNMNSYLYKMLLKYKKFMFLNTEWKLDSYFYNNLNKIIKKNYKNKSLKIFDKEKSINEIYQYIIN